MAPIAQPRASRIQIFNCWRAVSDSSSYGVLTANSASRSTAVIE